MNRIEFDRGGYSVTNSYFNYIEHRIFKLKMTRCKLLSKREKLRTLIGRQCVQLIICQTHDLLNQSKLYISHYYLGNVLFEDPHWEQVVEVHRFEEEVVEFLDQYWRRRAARQRGRRDSSSTSLGK
jgi:hypothetical protein